MSVEIFYIFDAWKCDFRLMERVHSIDGNIRAEVVRVSLGEGQWPPHPHPLQPLPLIKYANDLINMQMTYLICTYMQMT